ncbi:hypothetical protein GCM10011383_45790 [Hymenobacter cavernae]|uniref:Uncharacterized protein n=1 Tax=Hymenobacter cavernae TaxID=2044852 RepID=A0ABQ1UZA7_9BACT|nr:hypothetical protein GCM10011383_45790 [Hymenobacter cavernae]
MTAAQLAWAHFRKASWLGFLCLPVGAALVGAAQAWVGQPGYPAPSLVPIGLRVLSSLATAWAWLLGSAIWGSIFLGVPALLFGLLRQPLMWLLFTGCRTCPPATGRILALVGTLALFEFPVWLLGNLLRHVHTYGYSVHLFCFGVSLPWLVGSLWATWLLRQELQTAS